MPAPLIWRAGTVEVEVGDDGTTIAVVITEPGETEVATTCAECDADLEVVVAPAGDRFILDAEEARSLSRALRDAADVVDQPGTPSHQAPKDLALPGI